MTVTSCIAMLFSRDADAETAMIVKACCSTSGTNTSGSFSSLHNTPHHNDATHHTKAKFSTFVVTHGSTLAQQTGTFARHAKPPNNAPCGGLIANTGLAWRHMVCLQCRMGLGVWNVVGGWYEREGTTLLRCIGLPEQAHMVRVPHPAAALAMVVAMEVVPVVILAATAVAVTHHKVNVVPGRGRKRAQRRGAAGVAHHGRYGRCMCLRHQAPATDASRVAPVPERSTRGGTDGRVAITRRLLVLLLLLPLRVPRHALYHVHGGHTLGRHHGGCSVGSGARGFVVVVVVVSGAGCFVLLCNGSWHGSSGCSRRA